MLRFAWRVGEGGERGQHEEFAASFGHWWSQQRETHHAWLAERPGGAIGMAWLAVVHRVPGPVSFRRLAGLLQSVYVVPPERGNGTGARLVDAVVEQARSDGLDYLTVHPSERSYGLYQRAGFTDSGRALELGLRGPRLPFGAPPVAAPLEPPTDARRPTR